MRIEHAASSTWGVEIIGARQAFKQAKACGAFAGTYRQFLAAARTAAGVPVSPHSFTGYLPR